MKAGEKRQRKLTKEGQVYRESIALQKARSAKRKVTHKLKKDVDDLADLFGKMGTSPKKEKQVVKKDKDIDDIRNLFGKMKYGGKKRRATRRKSKKVSK